MTAGMGGNWDKQLQVEVRIGLTYLDELDSRGTTLAEGTADLAKRHFGLNEAGLLGLCAAPRKSHVRATWVDSWKGKLDDDEQVPPGLHVVVQSEYMDNEGCNEFVIFRVAETGEMSLYLKLIDFKAAYKGIGGDLVYRIANQACQIGLKR